MSSITSFFLGKNVYILIIFDKMEQNSVKNINKTKNLINAVQNEVTF